jgi:hypothetical protein
MAVSRQSNPPYDTREKRLREWIELTSFRLVGSRHVPRFFFLNLLDHDLWGS